MKFMIAAATMAVAASAAANDYPTLERVDHVLTCMRQQGGQTVDNLYACACEIDVIAQQVGFDDFAEARTFEIYKRMPGEKGGLFRDSDRADDIVSKLEAARADARKRCFIGGQRSVRPAGPASAAGTPKAAPAGGDTAAKPAE
ncbi:MAG: hypothetical protein RLW62_00190 [Gammaproteobacteria bacterium]